MPLPLANAEGCTKPNCGHRAALNRHHRGHEALWFGPFAHRATEAKWQLFIERYKAFREEDIVRICIFHHAEIHSIYDKIINEDIQITGLALYLYSWRQAEALMRKLRRACAEWLKRETPGLDPDSYESSKALRRSLLQRDAEAQFPTVEGHERLARERREKLRRKKRQSQRRKP